MIGSAIPRLSLVVSVLALALCVPSNAGDSSEWRGTCERIDGVVTVRNPAQPLEGSVHYRLHDLWQVNAEQEDSLIFGVVADVAEDSQGNLLVLDSQLKRVLVLGAGGTVVRTFGRAGEGPGEFNNPTRLTTRADGSVAVLDPAAHRGVLFDQQGQPTGEWRFDLDGTPGARIQSAAPMRDSYAIQLVTYIAQKDEVKLSTAIHVFSLEGRLLRELTAAKKDFPRTRPLRFLEETGADLTLWDADESGRVLLTPSWRDYVFHLYDASTGRLAMIVERDYEPLPRTQEEMAESREYWTAAYGGPDKIEAVIAPFHRTISAASIMSDGTIWITSSHGWRSVSGDVAVRYDIFDLDGRFLQEAVVHGDVSPEDDLLFLLEGRLVRVAESTASERASVGAASGDDQPLAPSITCYEIRREK